MRILADVMGNPAQSGGMNLYAKELLAAWSEEFTEDEIVVVGGPWVREAFEGHVRIKHVLIKGSSVLHRLWVQACWSGLIARRTGCEIVLSLSPIGAFTFPADRVAVVVHDWRHRRRPEEFSGAQRLYRRLWNRSIRRAGTVIAISGKTKSETESYASPRRVEVVPNGDDHPRRWVRSTAGLTPGPVVLTYGHLVNKRADMVIRAIGKVAKEGSFANGKLIVLGARGSHREHLRQIALEAGVASIVEFPGFVSDAEYQSQLQNCDVIVLNSSDEGYGLPVDEGNYFGIPVLGASDSGLRDIHGDRVITTVPTISALSTAISAQLHAPRRPNPSRSSWADCARRIREEVTVRR